MRCKEYNFGKASMWEWSKADPADDLQPVLDYRHTSLLRIEHQAGDVLSRHDRQLLLEECLEVCEQDH
jgi:hypothetical protein